MARNLTDEDNEEENQLANNIVSYFPILPSMQVTQEINHSYSRKNLESKGNSLSFFSHIVFHFPCLA